VDVDDVGMRVEGCGGGGMGLEVRVVVADGDVNPCSGGVVRCGGVLEWCVGEGCAELEREEGREAGREEPELL
jgi:hypothetical protein